MGALTGKTLGCRSATESGAEEYGHRISCLAASADGRWVAAGTGPEGLTFVGSAAESRLVAVLEHGGRTVELVHFSPDSKALASFVPGTLKIWNVAQWDQSPGPGSPAGAQPATSPTTTPATPPEPWAAAPTRQRRFDVSTTTAASAHLMTARYIQPLTPVGTGTACHTLDALCELVGE
jgi:hypothetical protein